MNNPALAVTAFFASILGAVYFWAAPDSSYSGIVLLMMLIAVGSIAKGLASSMNFIALGAGFMFAIGSIFVAMQAKNVREATSAANTIILAYPDVVSTAVIPSTSEGLTKRWRIKTDNSVRMVTNYYKNPENLGGWQVVESGPSFIKLVREAEELLISFKKEDWTYAEFRYFKGA